MNSKIYLLGLLGCLMLNFSSCTKYEPLFGVADHGDSKGLTLNKDFAYIHDNDIYLADQILANPKKLTSSPSSTKTHIALSPNHDKIAYLDANNTPVIIDTSGNQLAYLSQYANAKDMQWHPNNGNPCLVILVNNSLSYYGSSMGLPSNPFGFVFPSDATFTAIDAFDISDNFDIAFSFRYQKPFSPTSTLRRYYHGVGIDYYSGAVANKFREIYDSYYSPSTSSYSSLSYPYYHSLNFNEVDNNVTLGLISNGSEGSFSAYSVQAYNHTSSSSNPIVSQSTTLSSTGLYNKRNEGIASSNPYQIRKFLYVIPTGVPEPTGTANTWTLNFSNQNNTPPTYFDWNP